MPTVYRDTVQQPEDTSIRYIALTKNQVAIVDAEDYERLNSVNWYARTYRGKWYATKNGPKINRKRSCNIHMHQLVLPPKDDKKPDHIDGNGLNNRKNNLRLATQVENSWNKVVSRRNKTGLKGISYRKDRGYWIAKITINWKTERLGCFKTPEEAHAAYMEKAKELHGEFFRA